MRRYFEALLTFNMAATTKVCCAQVKIMAEFQSVKLGKMLLPKILRLLLGGLASLTSDPGKRKPV